MFLPNIFTRTSRFFKANLHALQRAPAILLDSTLFCRQCCKRRIRDGQRTRESEHLFLIALNRFGKECELICARFGSRHHTFFMRL